MSRNKSTGDIEQSFHGRGYEQQPSVLTDDWEYDTRV